MNGNLKDTAGGMTRAEDRCRDSTHDTPPAVPYPVGSGRNAVLPTFQIMQISMTTHPSLMEAGISCLRSVNITESLDILSKPREGKP